MNTSRTAALDLLKKYVRNEKMLIHSLESEAVLRALARELGRDEDEWGLAGLLHDIDVEVTHADPKTHALMAAELLQPLDCSEAMLDAIRMHNEEATGMPRTTEFQHALAAGETITGMIHATTLVYPEKKIAAIKYNSVIKRMKQPAFAASVKRENIMECEAIGLPLERFVQLAVDAMRDISEEIGL
ncbi:MAG: HDIG domain-containing metalloprotein [Bacteroidota bacterium]